MITMMKILHSKTEKKKKKNMTRHIRMRRGGLCTCQNLGKIVYKQTILYVTLWEVSNNERVDLSADNPSLKGSKIMTPASVFSVN